MPRQQDAATRTSVYIIASGDYIKIGVSVDPKTRLRSMGSGIAVKPVLYYAREFGDNVTAFAVEKMMHRRFHKRREHGEWFAVSPKEARGALARMAIPTREHLESDGGKGWKDPTKDEIRDAMNRAFSGRLDGTLRLDV
jgi:hypothetical protein